MKKLEDPTAYFFGQADDIPKTIDPAIQAFVRGLTEMEYCPLCHKKYHLKENERVPRIIVHCGHTFCTECLTQFYMYYLSQDSGIKG